MDDKRLDEIEARHKAATPGPWTDQETGYSKTGYADGEHYHQIRFPFDPNIDTYPSGLKDLMSAEDAAFIAHARDDVPDLAAEVRRLHKWFDDNAALLAVHGLAKFEEEDDG